MLIRIEKAGMDIEDYVKNATKREEMQIMQKAVK